MPRKASGMPLTLYPLRVDADVRAKIDEIKSLYETVNAGLREHLLVASFPGKVPTRPEQSSTAENMAAHGLAALGLSAEALSLIQAEAERLSAETGKPVTETDVIEMAMVKWCSPEPLPNERGAVTVDRMANDLNAHDAIEIVSETVARRAAGETAMRETESKPVVPPVSAAKRSVESVAQRKARESREHAAALAEGDTVARMVGRDDIDYDLDNVQHRSVAAVPIPSRSVSRRLEAQQYEVTERKVKPLARPHGNTEPKRRREQ